MRLRIIRARCVLPGFDRFVLEKLTHEKVVKSRRAASLLVGGVVSSTAGRSRRTGTRGEALADRSLATPP